MRDDNPYRASEEDAVPSTPTRHVLRNIGTAILTVGLAILAYGAIGFWFINSLPPNGGASGRLPSLYVMAVGIVVAVVGLIARDLRIGRHVNPHDEVSRKGIPTSYGILGLLAIVIVVIFVISRL